MKIDEIKSNHIGNHVPAVKSLDVSDDKKREAPVRSPIKDPSLLRQAVKALSKNELSKEAKEIAKKLQNMVDESNIRFVVKDPTATGDSNVVIEVLNEHNQVVARIPEDVINDVHKEVVSEDAHKIPKGMIVDTEIA